MRSRSIVALLVILLAACRAPTPTAGPSTETPPAPVVTPAAQTGEPASPSATPLAEASASPTQLPPATSVAPTPTSFAEGLTTRLGTPDPSPNCPAHYPWFFDNPAVECADFIHNIWTVAQPFEHGLMVWFQEGGTYVLVDDGSLFKPYRQVFDLQGLPFPEPDPNLVPPEGLYVPTLGFALFWRGIVPGHEWVRQSLGWATAPETAFSGLWQCNTAAGNDAHCYFTGPRDEVISLTRGGAQYWNYYQRAVR
jgi:hypothetical protein